MGYAGGNNVGIRYALKNFSPQYIWILNNDTVVATNSLQNLIARMEEDSDIGLCGATILYADVPNLVQSYAGGRFSAWRGRSIHAGWHAAADAIIDPKAVESQLGFINGACVLASRRFLEVVGLMEERYFLYYEEPNWGARAKGRFKLGYAADAIVRHKVGRSIGTGDFGDRSLLSEYYLRRNRVRFCTEFSPLSLPIVAFDTLKTFALCLARGQRRRAWIVIAASLGVRFDHDTLARG